MDIHYLAPVFDSYGKIKSLVTHSELDDDSLAFCWAIPIREDGKCFNNYYTRAEYRNSLGSRKTSLVLYLEKNCIVLSVANQRFEFQLTEDVVRYSGCMDHSDFKYKFRVIEPAFDQDDMFEKNNGLYIYGVGFDGYKKKEDTYNRAVAAKISAIQFFNDLFVDCTITTPPYVEIVKHGSSYRIVATFPYSIPRGVSWPRKIDLFELEVNGTVKVKKVV